MLQDLVLLLHVESCYGKLKEDVLSFIEEDQVVLFGDFNARVGRSV